MNEFERNGWEFVKERSNRRTKTYRKGNQYKAVIEATRRIYLCHYIDRICGKDNSIRRKVVSVLRKILTPLERKYNLKFAYDSVTLDYNDINRGDSVWDWEGYFGFHHSYYTTYLGGSSAKYRPFFDWDISDVPDGMQIDNVDLKLYRKFVSCKAIFTV